MKKLITPLLISLLYSCQSDVTDYIPFVEGYWEIVSATKDQKKIKDFKISGVIDYFKINDDWFLVDLPGYGYAKISKKKRTIFQYFIENYFKEREQLVCTFVLIDSRHDPQKIDLDFMQFLGENQIPFCIVFTKADKLGSSKLNKQITSYKKKLLQFWQTLPTSFLTFSFD